ncbi:MAG: peroxiredoxin-like family protein [Bacteroidota bacterium]
MTRLSLALLVFGLAACSDPDAPVSEPPPQTDTAATDTTLVTAEMAAARALGVGDAAPDFALPDVDGETVRLGDVLEQGPVILTFYRGAWCPYCNTQLRDYQQRLTEIETEGATLVAISPQLPDSSIVTQTENELAFPVLSDVGGEVSDAYGLTFEVEEGTRDRYRAIGIDLAEAHGTPGVWELPVPGTFVIAPDGTIRSAFVEADYTQRASVQQILDALAAL